MQNSVDVPDPLVTVSEDSVQSRFVELLVTPSVTVPVKPFNGETVMTDDPETPIITLTLVRVAEIVKSSTW